MPKYLMLTIRFLDLVPSYHGRRDGDDPEWPPSPLRVFQALIPAFVSRWSDGLFEQYARPALEWLQQQKEPEIIAPAICIGNPFRIAVPNNDLDVWAGPVSKGNEPKKQPNELKAMKTIRPIRILPKNGDPPAVHYLYPIPDTRFPHAEALQAAARAITHLGWGIDMVAGNAEVITEEQAAKLAGERWVAAEEGCVQLRTPVAGTLAALTAKHEAFLNRLAGDGFRPVPPLKAFDVVGYRRVTDPAVRPWAAFSILKPDASGNRAFDPRRKTMKVAGMVRHAAGGLAKRQGWTDKRINEFIHGKNELGDAPASGDQSPDRFSYLPLPTVSAHHHRIESIRRVLITAPTHCREQIDWIRRALAGEELMDEDTSQADGLLTILPSSDWVLKQYTKLSQEWSTVTPVILPGHDDCRSAKAESLLRKAFRQAGYSMELVEQAELEWRKVGFHAGVDLASRYVPPENLSNKPRYHVIVRFPHQIPGPLAVGSGRFRGFGLFAAMD